VFILSFIPFCKAEWTGATLLAALERTSEIGGPVAISYAYAVLSTCISAYLEI
jgi:hypothetical protein